MVMQKIIVWIPTKSSLKNTITLRNFSCDSEFLKTPAAYSKNKSRMCLMAPCWTSSFSAASLPNVSKTEMNSTIWKFPFWSTISTEKYHRFSHHYSCFQRKLYYWVTRISLRERLCSAFRCRNRGWQIRHLPRRCLVQRRIEEGKQDFGPLFHTRGNLEILRSWVGNKCRGGGISFSSSMARAQMHPKFYHHESWQ